MRTVTILAILSIIVSACSDSGGDGTTTTGAAAVLTAQPNASTPSAASSTVITEPVASTSSTSTNTPSPVDTSIEPPPFDTWTSILASLPVDEFDHSDAISTASEFIAASAGVVLSDDYPSLNSGYWAVFSGSYEYAWEAVQRCARLAEREVNPITDCYPRYLGIDPAQPVHMDQGLALAMDVEGAMVAVSLESGEVVRTIGTHGGDGRYPSSPQLSPQGTEAYYTVGVEDYWFSCEASDGHLVRLDLATGAAVKIGDGFSPRVSTDGRSLLYLAASECFPDPEEPSQFVKAPIDTIVIRDLTTGRERRHLVPRPAASEAGYELLTVAWGPTTDVVYVGDVEGLVRRFPAQFDGPAAGHEVIRIPGASFWNWSLIGFHTSSAELLVEVETWRDDMESAALIGIWPGDGEVDLVEIERYDGRAAFGLDSSGDRIVTATPDRLIFDGREVEIEGDYTLIDW